MKRLITFISFLMVVYTSNSQSFGRVDWCKAYQKWSTWCGHATVEMLSCGMVLQEESATFHGIFHLIMTLQRKHKILINHLFFADWLVFILNWFVFIEFLVVFSHLCSTNFKIDIV